jgi:cobalt-zinc-cadmium efflux system membrane fusion protein
MNTHQKAAALIACAVAIAITACGERAATDAKPKVEAQAGGTAKSVQTTTAQKQFLTVETVGPSQSTDVLSIPGRATFRPQAQSAVGATVAGRVVTLHVRAGEVVKAGAPVITIESADASTTRANLDLAATRLAAAENVHRRNVEMIEKGVGLESERHEAEVRLKEARTEQERARQAAALIGKGQSGRVTVTAPTNGVVLSIRVAVGATVAPGGEALLELGDPSLLQIVAQVAESDLRRIAIGQHADVELPGLAVRVAARVENISPRVDAESRRMQIYLTLAKRIDGLQAGMLAQIALNTGSDTAISLPVSAVLIKDGKRRVVYVEKPDGKFEARDVETGRNRDGQVIILKGLASGDRVVVRGALLLDAQAELLL